MTQKRKQKIIQIKIKIQRTTDVLIDFVIIYSAESDHF